MQRPLGPGSNSGLPHRMAGRSMSESLVCMPSVLEGRDSVSRDRGRANATERGNLTGKNWNGPRQFPFQHIPSPQERRGPQADHQLEEVERICPAPSLQDGRDSYAKRPLETRGLYGQDRPEGRLLCGANK